MMPIRERSEILESILSVKDRSWLKTIQPLSAFASRMTASASTTRISTLSTPHWIQIGGKGLGRFTRLKAFDRVEITSTFTEDDHSGLLRRNFVFDEDYDLDDRGLPTPT